MKRNKKNTRKRKQKINENRNYAFDRHIRDVSSDYTIEFDVKNPKIPGDPIFDIDNDRYFGLYDEFLYDEFLHDVYIPKFETELHDKLDKEMNDEKFKYVAADDLNIDVTLLGRSGGWLAIGLDFISIDEDRYYEEDDNKFIFDTNEEYEWAVYDENGKYIPDFAYFDYDGKIKENSTIFTIIEELVEKYFKNFGEELKKYFYDNNITENKNINIFTSINEWKKFNENDNNLVGKTVMIDDDNDNDSYDEYRDKELVITDANNSGMGYDDSMYPMYLCDFIVKDTGEEVPFSLYEYEFVIV